MSKDRFTVDDLVRIGVCAKGIRRWFSSRGDDLPEGVNFRDFMREGMTIEQARALKDGVVDRALSVKGARE